YAYFSRRLHLLAHRDAGRRGNARRRAKGVAREPASVLARQLSRQRRDNPLAVGGTLSAEDVLTDSPTDVPVENDEAGVDRLGDPASGRLDKCPHVRDESLRGRRHFAHWGCSGERSEARWVWRWASALLRTPSS